MSKSLKDRYRSYYKLMEERVPKLVDKYSMVKRLFIVGIGINLYLLYVNVHNKMMQLKKFGVLRQAESYIEKRQKEFNKVHDLERERILNLMHSDK